MKPRAVFGKAAENDSGERWCGGQRFSRRADRDLRGAVGRKTIDAGGNRGKGQRTEPIFLSELDRAAIARRQQGVLALSTAVPDRPDGMDHMPRRQPITPGDLGVTGGAAMERAALGQQFGPGRAMDRAIDAATAEQRAIRRVDDGVNAQRRDVGNEDLEPRRAELARRKDQAEAAALSVTPLSARSCCNSPAWNISRIMSQPPMNSPLT